MPGWDRRTFLRGLAGAGAGALAGAGRAHATPPVPLGVPLARRFRDLGRHFAFEYYPWYGGPPDYEHWDYLERRPPLDLATRYVPKLGAYDVRSVSVLEQHARSIREAGVGAVALSWWGRNSWENQAVPLILDVLHAHDLKATFALEPYTDDRARRYAGDVLYLLDEYGQKRHWDAFLLLRDATGRFGPVFKSFRTVLPEASTDCLGETHPVSDFTADSAWRQQTDSLRETLRQDFDHVTLLADSLEFSRTPASGFDGVGIYDNFIPPEAYRGYAEGASRAGLLFSFNVNPGYDQIEPRHTSDPCYTPRAFAPPTPGLDFAAPDGRERAALASAGRIRASWAETLAVQLDPALQNARRGFLLVYVNSWNEWHEGHAFEPMKDAAELTADERALTYRNPANGSYRLQALAELQRELLAPSLPGRQARRKPIESLTRIS
jgi:Glycosyl hydrolase family 99